MAKENRTIIITISLLLAIISVNVQSAPLTQINPNAVIHIVGWGDTIYSIARLYGVSVDEIMRLNDLSNPNYISVGQRLYITTGLAESPPEMEVGAAAVPDLYTVQRGDTLYSIARRFGSTVPEMARLNNIYDPSYIYVGQVLSIPGAPAAPAASATPGVPAASFPTATPSTGREMYYVVQPGDWLSTIALRYGTTAQILAVANNIANPALIHVGQRLIIPAMPPAVGTPVVSGTPGAMPIVNTPVAGGAAGIGTAPRAPIVPTALAAAVQPAPEQSVTPGPALPIVSEATETSTVAVDTPGPTESGTPRPTSTLIFRAATWPTATPGPGNVPTLIPLEEKWLFKPTYPAPNDPSLVCRAGHISGIVYDVNGVPLGGVRLKLYNEWGYETITVSKEDKEPGVFDFVMGSEPTWWDLVVIDETGQAVSPAVTVQYHESPPVDGATCQNHVHWRKTQ